MSNETVFPAHAGMSPDSGVCETPCFCFPRSRGDEPAFDLLSRRFKNVFPAHAGMSLPSTSYALVCPSFPRSRGDEP